MEATQISNDAAKGPALVLECALTCPQCGAKTIERMPTDACIVFYECANCHSMLRPKPGDCCVFCSYGSVKCPPIQQSQACCDSAVEGRLTR
jgi:hypothetical protein